MSRYARQVCLPEVGTKGQARLAAARVLVVGAGGLGSALLPLLAGAGCGAITVADPDRVEEGNLHRQTLYRMADIGAPKAERAAEALGALNPGCRVEAHAARLDPPMARRMVPGFDLVIDAADSFAVTYTLSDICAANTPLISASVLGRSGHVGGFCGTAPSYRAVFPDLPAMLQSCAAGGVMGPAVAALGALQAQMALSVLLGHDPSPLGQLMNVDLVSWRVSSFRFDTAPEPAPAPVLLGAGDVRADDLVVELRPEGEAPALPVPGAIRLRPERVPELAPPASQRIVFVCATGLRAWRAARTVAQIVPNPLAIWAAGP